MSTLTADSMVARAILAANRPVRSAGAPARPGQMARHEVLEVWYDPQHAFLITAGCLAMRAVNDQGRFCWLVRQIDECDGLSFVKNPYDVAPPRIDDEGMRVPYPAVTELAASLRRGDTQTPLAPHDLCEMPATRGMPGWLANWLVLVALRIGRAIRAGRRRSLASPQARRAMHPTARMPGGLAA